MNEVLTYNKSNNLFFNLELSSSYVFMGKLSTNVLKDLLCVKKTNYIKVFGKELNKKNYYQISRVMKIVLLQDLNIFVTDTVGDEIAFGLESNKMKRKEIIDTIKKYSKCFELDELLDKDVYSLSSSQKAKVKILSSLITKPKILIINDILQELDYNDKILVYKELKEYVKSGNTLVNFTSNLEEALIIKDTTVIVTDNNKIIVNDKCNNVFKKDVEIKKLGYDIPFIYELNNLLIEYGLIDKYTLSIKKLVDKL